MNESFGFDRLQSDGTALAEVGHTLLVDDDLTRVWALRLAPGAALPYHVHRHPYALVALSGGRLQSQTIEGTSEVFELSAGDIRRVDTKRQIEMLANIGEASFDARLIEYKSVRWIFADEPVERPEIPAGSPDGFAAAFREILIHTADQPWVPKSLAGLSQKMLWRNEETGASIALIRFEQGVGIPNAHAHASNQFMFCLSGRYRYVPTGTTLVAGSFYCNPVGSVHGPTVADETTVFLEIYDGPHYPVQPPWYTDEKDAH